MGERSGFTKEEEGDIDHPREGTRSFYTVAMCRGMLPRDNNINIGRVDIGRATYSRNMSLRLSSELETNA